MQIIPSPGGRLIYGIFHTSRNIPNFVAVALDGGDSRIYRLQGVGVCLKKEAFASKASVFLTINPYVTNSRSFP